MEGMNYKTEWIVIEILWKYAGEQGNVGLVR